MISIRINDRREIQFGSDGNIAFVSGSEAIEQNCKTAVSAQYKEMIFAMQEGVPMLEAVWNKYNPAQFEAASRKTLLKVAGVVEVLSFEQSKEDDSFSYSAQIKTVYGTEIIAGFFNHV